MIIRVTHKKVEHACFTYIR